MKDNWMKEELKALREKSGLSQQKFADKYGIPFRTFQDWELGNRVPPEYVIEMLAKVVGLEDFNLKGYSFNEYSDKGGVGSEQIFKTKAGALKAAQDYWEHLSERDKDDYRQDPGAYFVVEEVSLAWDDTDMEFVRDNEAGGDLIWSAL